MKDIHKNPSQLILALFISWIVTYGTVFAQPLCCGTITDSCRPVFSRFQFDETHSINCNTSTSLRRNPKLPAIAVSERLPKNVDAKSSCCANDPCDGFNLTAGYNKPLQHCPILQVKKVGSFYSTSGLQDLLNQQFQSVPLHPTSIYILTKSIIC